MISKEKKIIKKLLDTKNYQYDELSKIIGVNEKELTNLLVKIFREKIAFKKNNVLVDSDFRVGLKILDYLNEILKNDKDFLFDISFVSEKINTDILSRFSECQKKRLKRKINSKLRDYNKSDLDYRKENNWLLKNIIDFLSNKNNHESYVQFIKVIPTLIEKKDFDNNLVENLLDYYFNLLLNEKDIFTIYYCEQIILKIINEINTMEHRNKILNKLLFDKSQLKYRNLDGKLETRYLLFINEIFNCFDVSKDFTKIKLTNKLECKYQLNLSTPPINDTEMMNKFAMVRAQNTNHIQKKIITIDDVSSKFYDDALSFETLDNGNYLLTLYVSDVSSMVEKGSRLDVSALEKGNNIYVDKKVYPILPFEFMSDYLTLKKNNTRGVVAYKFEFSPSFDLVNTAAQVEQGIIQVTDNLNYADVFEILNKPKNKKDYIMIKGLIELSEKLGELFKNDRLTMANRQHLYGSKMIRNLMIFLNHYLAEQFKSMDLPFIYRGNKSVADYGKLFGVDKEKLYRHLRTKDTFSYYSNKPVYHGELELDTYAHTTSPIRNYASLENQRLIKKILIERKKLNNKEIYELEKNLYSLSIYLNNRSNLNADYVDEREYTLKRRK